MTTIRKMLSTDAPILATYHTKISHLPAQMERTVVKVYQAIYKCPSVQVFVAVDDQNQIEGFCLAISERGRVVSELFSYIPLAVIDCLRKNLTQAKELLKLLGLPLSEAKSQAEIAVLYDHSYNKHNLESLLSNALGFLASRGKNEVYFAAPEFIPRETLQSQGFAKVSSGELTHSKIKSESTLYKATIVDPVDFVPGPFSMQDRLRCFFRFEQMVVYPIYCGCLIPFASYLAYLAKNHLDPWLGLENFSLIPTPWNWLAFAICLLVGGLILVYSYSYLILEGEGGPVPPWSSQTRRLVVTGPYTYIRHPSIWAKLIGVCGLGLAFNSISFLVIVIPLLMVWSVLWNRHRQDEGLILAFGDEYLAYKEKTPMLIPHCLGNLFCCGKKIDL